jgi:rubrerythrin
MAEKPTYLGLLNGIAVAERRAHDYLAAWADRTSDPDLRATLRTVAAREIEHAMSFAKRIDELGFEVREADNLPDFSKQMEIVTADCSDYDKAEALGLFKAPAAAGEPDLFDNFFRDHSIDIRTGELLGRYIAEERDTGRMIADCAARLKARHEGASGGDADRLAGLEAKLDQVCVAVAELTATVAGASANGRTKAKAKTSA